MRHVRLSMDEVMMDGFTTGFTLHSYSYSHTFIEHGTRIEDKLDLDRLLL